MDPRRRRALLRTWAPTAVVLALILAVGVTTAVLLANGLGAPAPAPTSGQVTEENRSVFTREGIEYLTSTRVVRIDLSAPPVAAAPLGLPDEGELALPPIATGDTELDYTVKVYGGGEAPGGLTVVAPTLTIRTAGGSVAGIEAPSRDVVAFRTLLADLAKRSDELGWPAGEQERVLASVAAGEPFSFELGPGDRLGLSVAVRADCGADGYCAATWLFAPAG